MTQSPPCPSCGRTPAAVDTSSLVRRASVTAALVGSALVLINQGSALLSGQAAGLWWRVPLTYLVPFCVSLHSALRAARR